MKPANEEIIARNSVFLWIALATGSILLIPLIAMQFTQQVNWNAMDFAVMGALLFSSGSLFVIVSRRCPRNRRLIAGAVFVATFLYTWAELAVGGFIKFGI